MLSTEQKVDVLSTPSPIPLGRPRSRSLGLRQRRNTSFQYNSRGKISRRVRRRSAKTTVFPQHRTSLRSVLNELRDHTLQETTRRLGSLVSQVGVDWCITFIDFFQICDSDEDGNLTKQELLALLTVLDIPVENDVEVELLRKKPLQQAATLFRINSTLRQAMQLISLQELLTTYRSYFRTHLVELPTPEFLSRCRRLKVGFKRCDTDGTNMVTTTALEIALQKLDVMISDASLHRLIKLLNGGGSDTVIPWNAIIVAAWRAAKDPDETDYEFGLSLLEALAKLPAPAISHVVSGSHLSLLLPEPGTHAVVPDMPSNNGVSKVLNLIMTFAVKSRLLGRPPPETSIVVARRQSVARSGSLITMVRTGVLPSTARSRFESAGTRFLTHISMRQISKLKRVLHIKKRERRPSERRLSSIFLTQWPNKKKLLPPMPECSEQNSKESYKCVFSTNGRVAPRPIVPYVERGSALSSAVRSCIVRIEYIAILIAAILGVGCGLLSIRLESLIPSMRDHDETNGDMMYYIYFFGINIMVTLIEVNGMYLTAVICAFRLTVATKLRLYPQDTEREFLTRAIARAALQVGTRKDKIFGIDPMRDSPRLVLCLSIFMYKSKRYVLKFLVKLFVKRVLWRAAAKMVLSLIVLPINALLNAWTLHGVMRSVRITIIGPPCLTAVVEEFFTQENDTLRPFERVDYMRVVGCTLVCKRCIHPNMEIMVDQLRREWVTVDQWPIDESCSCLIAPQDTCSLHPLDDTERMLSSLELYRSQCAHQGASMDTIAAVTHHERNIFFFLIVALIIDGQLNLSERRLYVRMCHAARMQNHWSAIRKLQKDFVSGRGIQMATVYSLIVKRQSGSARNVNGTDSIGNDNENGNDIDPDNTPLLDMLLFIGDRISSLLAI